MGIIPPRPNKGRSEHPWWCDRPRCLAGVNARAEHRSTPHVVGPLVLTMVAPVQPAVQERWSLSFRARVRLLNADEAGALHAARLTQNVLDAIERAKDDHSGQYGRHNMNASSFDFTMGGDL